MLRVVPGGLREASLALGASQWRTVWRVVLPTARPGLATALILGIARGIGETAPVLITSGASTFFNANPLDDPMNSLPLFIYIGGPQRRAELHRPRLRRRQRAARRRVRPVRRDPLSSPGNSVDRPMKRRTNMRISPAKLRSMVAASSPSCWCYGRRWAATPAQAAAAHALIQGSGSTWAANAVNQWIADVQSNGLQVVFTSQGSAQGRKDFANNTTDFGVSDIGYQGTDPIDRQTHDTSTAGRTPTCRSSPAARRSRTRSRSAASWSATCGCPGRRWPRSSPTRSPTGTTRRSRPTTTVSALPSLPIIPVVHSEGSGSTSSSPPTWPQSTRASGAVRGNR